MPGEGCTARRRVLRPAALLAALLLAAFGVGAVSALTWNVETVDAEGQTGAYPSLELDGSGSPRISYGDLTLRALRYAAREGSTWHLETVDQPGSSQEYVGWFSSLALDGSGTPRISYLRTGTTTSSSLKYAARNGSGWEIETVDPTVGAGYDTSLALDGAGHPVISYVHLEYENLTLASRDGPGWEIDTVEGADSHETGTSLVLDSAGNPHVSYRARLWFDGDLGYGLRYAWFDGWNPEIVTVDVGRNVGAYSSLALDGAGNPHISYYNGTGGDLKYASWTGSAWRIETVDSAGDVGRFTSLALDSADRPRIGYYDSTNGDLKYAAWNGTGWEIETVDAEGDVGGFSSLELDDAGTPSIGYCDASRMDLKFASAFAPPVVAAVPPGADLPTDTDGDGLFDDVNGNNRADFADVVLFFNQMAWIAANEPLDLFDCNGNGRIDFADVVWLFNNL